MPRTDDQRANPFPGLRPFQPAERHWFFGRDGQSEELLRRLSASRFLAVVGESGSGKSSLVKAGLLPLLHGGYLAGAGSRWRVLLLRPGQGPISALATELNDALGPSQAVREGIAVGLIEATLRRSAGGLSEVVRHARLEPHESVLVVVDQFEELFRFKAAQDWRRHQVDRRSGRDRRSGEDRRQEDEAAVSAFHGEDQRSGADRRRRNERRIARPYYEDEAAAFVKLLLHATRRREIPIYVVITMRSDFLGDCAQFRDLPEAINRGQYLIPRMTRDERRQAIEGPAAVQGASIHPVLVERLLNDAGDNPKRLPILQHVLMRMWDIWADANGGATGPIDVEHYDHHDVRGLEKALSIHADKAWQELSLARQEVARRLFTCLTEKPPNNPVIRRPAELGQICRVAEADRDDVVAVIDAFREPGRSFLTPAHGVPLEGDSIIDISHESLISNWERLSRWVEEEAKSADVYRRLADAAELHREGKRGLYTGPELQIAVAWWKERKPNRWWATRYHPGFELAKAFLDESEAARMAEEKRERNRRRRVIAAALAVAAVMSAAALYADVKRREAKEANRTVSNTDWQQSVGLIDGNRAPEALAYLARARRLNPANEPAGRLLANTLRYRDWPLLIAEGRHDDRVVSVEFNRDGTRFVTAAFDGTARLWDAETGESLGVLAHGAPVMLAAFAPNGTRVVTASRDKTARVWEIESDAVISLPHDGEVMSAAFSPDGKRVVTASRDGTARVWESETGDSVSAVRHDASVVSASFSPDGRRIVTASFDGTARVWEVETGDSVSAMRHDGDVVSAAFSPDARRVVTASRDGTARVWDAESGDSISVMRHGDMLVSADFGRDGKRVVTASFDGTARVWDAETGHSISAMRHGAAVMAAAFSADGQWVVTASDDRTAQIWDANTGAAVSEPMTHAHRVLTAALSPDGGRAVTGASDGAVQLWDVRQRPVPSQELRHQGDVHFSAFSPDGKRVVTASRDSTARLWDAETGDSVGKPMKHDDRVLSAGFSPDGRRVVTASRDGTARLWDAETGGSVGKPMKHDGDVVSAAFSPDGRRVVTASSDGKARVWDAETGDTVGKPMKHEPWVLSAAFSPDGRRVVTASGDGTARVWDAETGAFGSLLRHDKEVSAARFSPDGSRVVTASLDTTARVWDSETGEPIGDPMYHDKAVRSASFSPNGELIVTASDDGTARVWGASTGWPASPPLRHERDVESAAFSPDGRRIVTASRDSTAKLWQVDSGAAEGSNELALLARVVGGYTIDASGAVVLLPPSERTGALRSLRDGASGDCGARGGERRIVCRFLD